MSLLCFWQGCVCAQAVYLLDNMESQMFVFVFMTAFFLLGLLTMSRTNERSGRLNPGQGTGVSLPGGLSSSPLLMQCMLQWHTWISSRGIWIGLSLQKLCSSILKLFHFSNTHEQSPLYPNSRTNFCHYVVMHFMTFRQGWIPLYSYFKTMYLSDSSWQKIACLFLGASQFSDLISQWTWQAFFSSFHTTSWHHKCSHIIKHYLTWKNFLSVQTDYFFKKKVKIG